MKTSNKLLIGLLIAIFIIPLGLLMAFKQMVREGNYTAIQNNRNYMTSQKTGDYNVIKITVPAFKNTDSRKILICHLHSSKKGYYRFRRLSIMDSISITNERDTLFIEYVIKPHPNSTPTYYVHYNIDLYLPDMKDIIVNRATLQMDSIDAAINPVIGIHLTDAVFQWGDGINKENGSEPFKALQEYGPADKMAARLAYNNVSVSAGASQLIFGYHLQVDSLSLDIGKDSRLTIADDFHTGMVDGTISDEATIVSNMRMIRKLSGLHVW